MDLVLLSKLAGVKRIAISTNGSAPFEVYGELLDAGVNDLSISLDACCSADGEIMTGRAGEWEEVIENILDLAPFVYLTVGVVLSGQNMARAGEIIQFAADLGASDIRVIPAAQNGAHLGEIAVDPSLLERFPILRYRIENMRARRPVRGLRETDSQRCGLSVDDMAVCGNQHFPCIIYMREGGAAIGAVGPEMRQERAHWSGEHDTHADPICRKNCLDVCVQYNNTFAALNPKAVVSPDYPLPASAKTRIVAPDAP
jgi:MoaA/NifB/PqqE/SkfB family radical SAM enzyme